MNKPCQLPLLSPTRRRLVAAGAVAAWLPLPALGQIRAREFKLAFQSPRGNSVADGADKFAESVARLSGSKLKVNVFPGGALGGDLQMISGIRSGTIDMGTLSAGLLVGLIKEFELLDLPYLFDSMEHAEAVVDGPFGKKLLDSLDGKGVVPLGFAACNFRNLTNSRRAVTRLEDLQGLKIRVLQSPLALDLWKALGTNAVPMPFPELYTALEQKAVDGQENPVALILATKFYEVQKYLSMTRHVLLAAMGIFSKPVWDQLNNEERTILRQAWTEATKTWRDGARADEDAALTKLRTLMSVNDIAPAEIARIRAAARPVVDKHSASANPDVLKLLLSESERLRAQR
ncbi:MAG TPA: DctP family TRAP transporter solute-binding subunit [Burkholderiaceae bacterium]